MEEQEDHDFSEFEDVKTVYRRDLLPWWLWVILLLYNALITFTLITEVYHATQGYVFAFTVLQLDKWLVPYPFCIYVSVALWLGMGISLLLLWLEHKNAATVAMWCYGLMLALCTAILAKGLFTGHFWLRYEMIIFIDLLLRLSAGRYRWENANTRHDKITEVK